MQDMLDVPEPRAIAEVCMPDGTGIALRRHGNPDGPRLVLSHGNGLAIDLYYPFWSLLTDRFDLVLYDFRNHGWNVPGDPRSHNVATFVSDNDHIARGIDRHFGKKPWIGVFHSLSAVTALNQEPPGGAAAALVLFDPPILPPSGEPLEIDARWQKMRIAARLRPERYGSRGQFADMMTRSPMFARLRPGVADLASRVLLRPAREGDGYQLCCPPEYEAQVFEYIFAYNFTPDPAKIGCPVQVIGGDPTLAFSFLPSLDVSGLISFHYDFVPGATHYLQLENPEECVSTMVEFLERHGFVEAAGIRPQ
ncbi:MAG: alpha/beta hydrolase [Gemmatimonadetes bacterium]|nr:alpha/beta hydrolase [Gemmatimonadota bacterium]